MAMAPTVPSCLGSRGRPRKGSTHRRLKLRLTAIRAAKALELPGRHTIAFDEAKHLIFHRDQMYPVANLVSHPNGMRFSAFDSGGSLLAERVFYSIGGGFIISEEERIAAQDARLRSTTKQEGFPIPFTARLNFWRRRQPANITIPQLMLANECALVESGRRGDQDDHAPPEKRFAGAFCASGK